MTTSPSYVPSYTPSYVPSYTPSYMPSYTPSYTPSSYTPSSSPTNMPSYVPSYTPSYIPSYTPSYIPSYTPSNIPTPSPTVFLLTSLNTSLNFSATSTIALIGLCVLLSIIFVFVGVTQNSKSEAVELKFLAFHSTYYFYISSICTLAIALVMLVINDGIDSITLTILLFGNSFVAQISTIIGCKYYRAYCCWQLCGSRKCTILGYIWIIILFIGNIFICQAYLWTNESGYKLAVTLINALLCYFLSVASFASRIAQIHLCLTIVFLCVVYFGDSFSIYLMYWQLMAYVTLSIVAMFTLSQYHRLRILFFKVVASFLSLFDIATDIFVVSVWLEKGRIWEPALQLLFIFSGTIYSALFIDDYYNIHEEEYDSDSSDDGDIFGQYLNDGKQEQKVPEEMKSANALLETQGEVINDNIVNGGKILRVETAGNDQLNADAAAAENHKLEDERLLNRRKMVGRILTCLGFGRIYHGVLGWDETKNRDMMYGTKILKVWEMIFEGYPTIIFQFYIQLNAMIIGDGDSSSGVSLSIFASVLSLTNSFMRILYFDHRARKKKENIAVQKRLQEKQKKTEVEIQLTVNTSPPKIDNSILSSSILSSAATSIPLSANIVSIASVNNTGQVNIDLNSNVTAGGGSSSDLIHEESSSSHSSVVYGYTGIIDQNSSAVVSVNIGQQPSVVSYNAPKPMYNQTVILSPQQLQQMQQQLQQPIQQQPLQPQPMNIALDVLMQQRKQHFVDAQNHAKSIAVAGNIGLVANINLHLDFHHPNLSHIRDLGFTRQQVLTAYKYLLEELRLQMEEKENSDGTSNSGCCKCCTQSFIDVNIDVDSIDFANTLLDILYNLLKITPLRKTRERNKNTSYIIDFLWQNCVCCYCLRHLVKPGIAIVTINLRPNDDGGWKFTLYDSDNIFYFLIYVFFMTDFYVRIYPPMLFINIVTEFRLEIFITCYIVIGVYSFFMYYRMLKSDCKTYKNALKFFWTGTFTNTYWFLSTMYLPYLPTNVDFKPLMEEHYIRLSFQIVWQVGLWMMQIYLDDTFYVTLTTSIVFIVCAVFNITLTLLVFNYREIFEEKIAVKLEDEVSGDKLEDKH